MFKVKVKTATVHHPNRDPRRRRGWTCLSRRKPKFSAPTLSTPSAVLILKYWPH